MTTLPRHRTPGERRAQASAQAAIARALAHVPPPPAEEDEFVLGQQYPYVTPARARQIRHEIEETRAR
ncbi:hypothetical protein DER29_4320 [Micromonospora sp. M71_S20]|uniref:hypothetical protein n=1 Tax=Micromonospora sp. M71_S20 TaxID=592872 RepID=UPI000EAC75BE|nr:hypothetical protein [Micromonospora sp. M71_S20]RLK13303.1 hypothetical protein DER29_4320 [Micromonospora sp. M71_S20]